LAAERREVRNGTNFGLGAGSGSDVSELRSPSGCDSENASQSGVVTPSRSEIEPENKEARNSKVSWFVVFLSY